ncbi:cytochrome c oxidase assembly protein [Arthrobacter sp. FW306-05-C]|uniref:cytochrome c oxidase assembly protein n=1 Tax=unclassified Arthrobacter TaxID=235627 RepID=UPI001EEFA835|nr:MULTISPECIES: cytochrome c oxidase assembly protein [unclassified Arthrobacter]UKA66690.1 cytochrome c oxidase assembly protein [Arthrobacter sp. FW306-05-C]UKA71007.1 cytochrome c oxidase assembly protein [Arthrobacter sp. FW306-06-A]
MPPLEILMSSWQLDWAAAAFVVVAAVLYGWGMRSAARRGQGWPVWRAVAFYVLGLGAFVVLTCGFTGVYGAQQRWAFTIKISMLLFVVPLFIGLGKPLTLARTALPAKGIDTLNTVLASRPVRFVSNSFGAPLLGLALFSTFLTPAFYTLRTDPVAGGLLTLGVPLLGMLMALPIIEESDFQRSSAYLTLEFMFVFIELLIDAIPGILLSLNGQVLDHVMSVPSPQWWFRDAFQDQQFAGNLLWFICEVLDLPLIILMFVRFSRSDKREAGVFDELTDEQLSELHKQHLRGPH